MIDQACGLDPNQPRPAVRKVTTVDHETQALMNAGDALVAWLHERENGTERSLIDAERVLVGAAKELDAIGWPVPEQPAGEGEK
jgi:hypothetical protein